MFGLNIANNLIKFRALENVPKRATKVAKSSEEFSIDSIQESTST